MKAWRIPEEGSGRRLAAEVGWGLVMHALITCHSSPARTPQRNNPHGRARELLEACSGAWRPSYRRLIGAGDLAPPGRPHTRPYRPTYFLTAESTLSPLWHRRRDFWAVYWSGYKVDGKLCWGSYTSLFSKNMHPSNQNHRWSSLVPDLAEMRGLAQPSMLPN